ncbi:uncharacterized protein C1orf100-like [Amphiprion ocellaris]|uniref:uncharacterized protein C1orf100-like n=1 Tax=Amphiprion ocellaris TaxID=80972 RepID=UPI0016497C03|nr:uncharacterized protein C1orf100-like [Amphiprion ocellaris]
MAGSGVALRLHEFREPQDSKELDRPTKLTPKASRLGKDVQGLYPGQLARVHAVHSKYCGYNHHSITAQSLNKSLQYPNHQVENHQASFDICTLRALSLLRHSAEVWEQRPPQTAYQEHFGLQSPLFLQ